MATNAYCVKCKAKRDMLNEQKITMKNGKPATEGKCPVCGTKMFKIGGLGAARHLSASRHIRDPAARPRVPDHPGAARPGGSLARCSVLGPSRRPRYNY